MDAIRNARRGAAPPPSRRRARTNHLSSNGYHTAFINTLKMEPHYAG
jgi:hypothetical protein